MNKIIIAPDSFKGSLSALRCTEIISEEFNKCFPKAQLINMPIADGGEGSLDALIMNKKYQIIKLEVEGADRKKRLARYAINESGVAIIELAEACGIMKQDKLHPLTSNTYGFGQLIKDAINNGIKDIILCIGGSASTDAGLGLMEALGVKYFNNNHEEIRPCGKSLTEIEEIDENFIDDNLKDVRFTVMCDVNNPLHGENGAAYIYGPQKGATPEEVEYLDRGLKHINDLFINNKGIDMNLIEGSGAAGGVGAATIYFFNATLKSGIETILSLNNFENICQDADLIITGEGRVDEQSLYGKALSGIINKANNIPIIVICGKNQLDRELDNIKIYELNDDDSNADTMKEPEVYLRRIMKKICKDIR